MPSRTALAAAASVAGVVLAGTAALGANFGILASSDDTLDVSPTAVQTATPTSVAAATTPSAPAAAATPELLAYQVEGIGVVTLARTSSSLGVQAVDVDSQWTWTTDDSVDEVEIHFTSGTRRVEFKAWLAGDRVEVTVEDHTPAASVSGTTATTFDDDGPGGSDDQESSHEDDDEHEDEHEGGDDD